MKLGGLAWVVLLVAACGGTSVRTSRGTAGSGGTDAGGTSAASDGGGSGGTGATTDGGATDGTGARSDGGVTSGGGGSSPSVGGSTVGGTAATGATAGMADRCSDFSFLGTWQGNVLDATGEPKELLTLELHRDSDPIEGTFTYGRGAPPLPPTDPEEAWPPGYWDEAHELDYLRPADRTFGFGYTVLEASASGDGCSATLHFSVATTELWQDWCALQAPVHTDWGGWACVLRGDASSVNAEGCMTYRNRELLDTYPAFKCAACGVDAGYGYCACTEEGCTANRAPTLDYDLFIVSEGILTGTDPTCPDCTLRLERTRLRD